MEIKKRSTSAVPKTVQGEDRKGDTNLKTVSVVFYSLVLDLLAFTMILPLLPALLDHYKELDNGQGLYSWILQRINSIQVYIDAPERFSSVLFGGEMFFFSIYFTHKKKFEFN